MLDALAKQIGDILVQALRRQYTLQGHRLTGKLNSSIEAITRLTSTGANITIIMEEYGIIQNNGVPSSRIPYNPNKRTGATKSKYIEGLRKVCRFTFRVIW